MMLGNKKRLSAYLLSFAFLSILFSTSALAQNDPMYFSNVYKGNTYIKAMDDDSAPLIEDIKTTLSEKLDEINYIDSDILRTEITLETNVKDPAKNIDFEMLISNLKNPTRIDVIRYVDQDKNCSVNEERIVSLIATVMRTYTQSEFSSHIDLDSGSFAIAKAGDTAETLLQRTIVTSQMLKPARTQKNIHFQLQSVPGQIGIGITGYSLESENPPTWLLRIKAN